MAVTVWLKVVWIRFVSGEISSPKASAYVDFSFATCRYSKISLTMGYSSASSSSTSAAVDGPVLVRFRTGRPIFLNRITPSCLGELMLNFSPAWVWMESVSLVRVSSKSAEISSKRSGSTRIPRFSIRASTLAKGSSTFWYNSYRSSFCSSLKIMGAVVRITRTALAMYLGSFSGKDTPGSCQLAVSPLRSQRVSGLRQ